MSERRKIRRGISQEMEAAVRKGRRNEDPSRKDPKSDKLPGRGTHRKPTPKDSK